MVTVSVIVPNYNHQTYLRQRIETILSQTFQDFEIIILDDNSSDGSRMVIEEFRGHSKVTHIVYNEVNSGSTFKQWEKGIALAQGQYVWIAESDDWCEDTLLERLLAPLETDPRCVISYCQCYRVDDEGNIQARSHYPKLNDVLDGRVFVKQYMVLENAIWNASMVVWRKDKYHAIKKDFASFRFCGDWLFWIRLSALGKVAIDGRLLCFFRKHGSDVSGHAYASGFSVLEEIRLLNTIYDDGFIGDTEYRRVYKKKFKEFWLKRNEISPDNRDAILKLLRKPASPLASFTGGLLSAWWNKNKAN